MRGKFQGGDFEDAERARRGRRVARDGIAEKRAGIDDDAVPEQFQPEPLVGVPDHKDARLRAVEIEA